MIKTIISDLGNVIVYVDPHKITKSLAKYSNYDEKYIYDFFNQSLARKGFDKGKISKEKFFRHFKDNLNLKMSFNQFRKAWCACFDGLNKDMVKLLKKLKKNYRLILLSNTDEIHFNYLKKKYKILNIFDDSVLSYKVGYAKPNPMIFLKAIRKAKTSPKQIFFIDDIYSFVGVARMLKIKAAQYTSFNNLKIDLRKNSIKFK